MSASRSESETRERGFHELADVQDVDVNYYVLVPFTTAAAAEWAAGEVGVQFDCHVVGAAAVFQRALIYADTKDNAVCRAKKATKKAWAALRELEAALYFSSPRLSDVRREIAETRDALNRLDAALSPFPPTTRPTGDKA